VAEQYLASGQYDPQTTERLSSELQIQSEGFGSAEYKYRGFLVAADLQLKTALVIKEANHQDADALMSKARANLECAKAVKETPELFELWAVVLKVQGESKSENERMWFQVEQMKKETAVQQLRAGTYKSEKSPPTPASKIATCEKEKNLGNSFFKQGKLKEALEHYHRANMYITGLMGLNAHEEAVVKELTVAINNNMAACQIKNKQYPRALTSCKKVLDKDPTNGKALFRRGTAHSALKNYDEAQADLKAALEITPDDAAVKKEMQVLEQRMKVQDKRDAAVFAKMFQ